MARPASLMDYTCYLTKDQATIEGQRLTNQRDAFTRRLARFDAAVFLHYLYNTLFGVKIPAFSRSDDFVKAMEWFATAYEYFVPLIAVRPGRSNPDEPFVYSAKVSSR